MGNTSIFPMFFIGLGMPPLIPKMDALQLWMWKHGWFAAKQVFHQSLLKHPFFQSFSKSLAFLTSPKNACVVNVGDLAVSYPNWRNIGKTSIFPSILIAFARVEQKHWAQNNGCWQHCSAPSGCDVYIVNVPVHFVMWFIYKVYVYNIHVMY